MPPPPPAGRQLKFLGHIFIELTLQISCRNLNFNKLLNYLNTIDSRVPLVPSKYYIVYDTKKSLETDIEARTFDNDKSVPHFTLFQIAAECLFLSISAVPISKTSNQ